MEFNSLKSGLIILILTILVPFSLAGDHLTGIIVHKIDLESETDQGTFKLDELLLMDLGELGPVVSGFELIIKIPPSYRNYRDGFWMNILGTRDVEAQQRRERINGRFFLDEPLPGSSKMVIYIPLEDQPVPGVLPGTFVLPGIDLDTNSFLVFSILSVMKGIPPALLVSDIEYSVRSHYQNKGVIRLGSSALSVSSELEILVNGEAVYPDIDGNIIVPAGEHRVVLLHKDFDPVEEVVIVAKGGLAVIDPVWEASVPALVFDAPDEVHIYIDGNLVVDKETLFFTELGTHEVLFMLGDYRISRTIELNEKKNYRISLFLDIFVEEY